MRGEQWRQMWGAKVQQPCDMANDQLKATILHCIGVLDEMVPGGEPTEAMAKDIKEWCDENYEAQWHVVLGRNFGAQVVHQAHKHAFFYVGETAVMVTKT